MDDLPLTTDRQTTTGERASSEGISSTEVLVGARYVYGEMLGKGGMGEVLEAHDEQFGRNVAVKRLRTQHPSTKQVARFMREARIQGRLEHPAIVPVHELGREEDGRPYFAMKKLAGTTLADILKQTTEGRASVRTMGRYPQQRLLRAIADVSLAVELAHTRGYVHRDLKPDNIVLGEFGETYVLDWGVAKVTGEDDSAIILEGDTPELVTAQGATVGTPGYMSPEQARALPDVDGRADVYSLGCMLFEILTAQPLHPRGKQGMQSAVEGVDGRPTHRAPERDIPPELDDICAEATATERAKRIQTARELGDRIQMYLDGDRDAERRRTLAKERLAAAQKAFAAEDRAHAMRDAGRALALDPTLNAASALITRMIIEPPKNLPAEVEKQFNAENVEVIRRTLDQGMVAACGYLVFVPIFALIGGVSVSLLSIMAVCSLGSIGMLWWMRQPGRKFAIPPLVVLQLILIMTVSRIYSPFLLGPGTAAVTAAALMTGPQYAKRQASLIVVLTTAAVLVPVFAELMGWLPTTLTVSTNSATIHATMNGQHATLIVLALYTLCLSTSSVIISRGLRNAERKARREMHVQAWQLRQLVTDD
ncbi:MAG TPA: serine/threonine-protein kinase [Kofleriaceae bacterium]|jgi:serine/threonine-protein kinase